MQNELEMKSRSSSGRDAAGSRLPGRSASKKSALRRHGAFSSPSLRGGFPQDPRLGGSNPALFQIFGFTMLGAGFLLGWVFLFAFVV